LKLGNESKTWFYGFTGAMMTSFVLAGVAAEQTAPYYASLGAASFYLAHQVRVPQNVDVLTVRRMAMMHLDASIE
jgi:4-hydroxybenzoate polyprenyltransferase